MNDAYHNKKVKYTSRYSKEVREDMKKARKLHESFGLQHYIAPNPCEFLKKQVKRPFSEVRCEMKPQFKITSPYHPSLIMECGKADEEMKNFICYNICKASQNRCEIDRKYIDTRKGDSHRLENSGLTIKYVFKKYYGQTPPYIQGVKNIVQKEKEARNQVKEKLKESEYLSEIPKEEKEKILAGLKNNWARLNKLYSTQSICIDTLSKMQRKEKLEAQLSAIENDIKLLSANNHIYIAKSLRVDRVKEKNEILNLEKAERKCA